MVLGATCSDSVTSDTLIQSSLNSITPASGRTEVKYITTLAKCRSARGLYQTETHTALHNGYTFFRQVFHDSTPGFQAVIHHKTRGVQAGDTAALPPALVYAIRTHEFHASLLQLNERFHAFKKPVRVTVEGSVLFKLDAKDELDHPCQLLIEPETRHIRHLHFQNPMDEKERIEVTFSDWRLAGTLNLPHHINIRQGGKLFEFDFIRIIINDPQFKEQALPAKHQ